MSRSRALKVQITAGSVRRGRLDRISMKKEAGEALDAQLKNSRCVVGGTGVFSPCESQSERWNEQIVSKIE